ncbi:hypothetical protein ACLM5H_05525 [Fredinandcohnia humi]
MILYPPKQFDQNEWFIIFSVVAIWIILLWVRPRFGTTTIIMIWMFNVFLAETADFLIAAKPYDFYSLNDHPDYEWFDVVLYFLLYPPAALLGLHVQQKWGYSMFKIMGMTFLWAGVSVGLEWIALNNQVFTYKKWHLYYSLIVYILVFPLNVTVFRFVRKQIDLSTQSNSDDQAIP